MDPLWVSDLLQHTYKGNSYIQAISQQNMHSLFHDFLQLKDEIRLQNT